MTTPSPISWNVIGKEFGDSGELLDLYVTNAGLDGWGKFIALCNAAELKVSFFVDGAKVFAPKSVEEMFALFPDKVGHLSFELGGLVFDSHFRDTETIDVVVPTTGMSERPFALLLWFMKTLGKELGRDVTLHHDCHPDVHFLQFLHQTSVFQYTPSY